MNREQFLEELREFGIENTVPNISVTNAKFLRNLIEISKTQHMLEIGTANGYSAIHFAIELEKNDGYLDTIDFSLKSHEEAKKNIEQVGLSSKVNAIFGNALDEIPKLSDNHYDFIFIDGMMRRTKDFLELCWPKAKTGAIFIIDDVIKFKEKMTGFYEYLEKENIDYNILPIDIDDGIMMIIKK